MIQLAAQNIIAVLGQPPLTRIQMRGSVPPCLMPFDQSGIVRCTVSIENAGRHTAMYSAPPVRRAVANPFAR